MRWLISLYQNGLNGILADQMGLGKTVQTIGFLSHLWQKGIHGPFMVIGPLSTLPNWVAEFERWCPAMPAVLYHGSKPDRQQILRTRLPTGLARLLLSGLDGDAQHSCVAKWAPHSMRNCNRQGGQQVPGDHHVIRG